MTFHRTIRHPFAFVALAAVLIGGCLLSGQFVIVLPWGGLVSTSDSINSDHVDLSAEDKDWDDHKDKIQNVVDVKFEVKITNNLGTVASGEVYLSADEYTTLADIQQNAIRILHGIEIEPGTTRTISFNESVQFQDNLKDALALVETG